jgi:ribosomal-protein-alanine N-acetyltransferase
MTTKKILIRRAVDRDFMLVAELDLESWGDDPKDADIPDGEHAWRLWVEYAYVLIAEYDKKIVGGILAFPTIKSGN